MRHGNRSGRYCRRVAAVVVAVTILAAACVEQVEVFETGPDATTPDPTGGGTGAVIDQFAGERMSFGVVPDTPIVAEGDPIRIGMINQENTPLGSFPELRLGAEAAVAFIHEELGGVDGRPIELVPCITSFSVEQSQACAQELSQSVVVAVTGGIDITSNGSIPVLEQNQVPLIGGIPVNLEEMTSPISFQFSGGTPGAFAAFAHHAAESGAEKVAIAYGDYGPIKTAALEYGVAPLRARGVEVVEVPFPITGTDFLPVLTKANEGNPDAIFVGAADTSCAPAMRTAHDLGITARIYLVGSCAAPSIAEEVGEEAVDGRIFNVEGPVSGKDREGDLYQQVVDRYGAPDLPAQSAATVSFRGVMNLYGLLLTVGAEDASRESLLAAARAARNVPSFDGHPYTCDGQQIPTLPALCSPQQVLTERRDGGIVPITGWIDVPAVLRGEDG
jgi:branched-chain amino acid transport system substrate-binding protein